MSNKEAISIVVPALNEADNIQQLLARIDAPLKKAAIDYEVLIIDDHSSDTTFNTAEKLSKHYPVRVLLKDGKRGKAHSLIQGFAAAVNPIIVMIDADLQYPPEAIIPMYNLLRTKKADVIITDRSEEGISPLRKLSTKVFNFVFARLLFGIKFDTQSGLKLFRKNVLQSMVLNPSPWSFDLEFIVRSFENNFKIISYTIPFSKRAAGISKLNVMTTTFELIQASLKLRWRTSIRKTWMGQRENVKFLKKTFSVMVFLFVISGAAISIPRSASALTLQPTLQPASVLSPLTNLWDSVIGKQTVTTPVVTTPKTQTTPTTPTTVPPVTPPSTTSSSPTQAQTTPPSVSPTKASTSQATSTPQPTADKTKLSAVTGNEHSAALYPQKHTLSTRAVHILWLIIRTVLVASGLSLLLFLILLGVRKHKRYTYRKLSRS